MVAHPFLVQSRIAHAQLLIDAREALGYQGGTHRIAHHLQGVGQRVEGGGVEGMVVEVVADAHVAAGYLVGVAIALEETERLLPQTEGEQRIHRVAQKREFMVAVAGEEVERLVGGHQVGQPLQGVTLEVDMARLMGLASGGVEQVEAAQTAVVTAIGLHQSGSSLQVGGIEALCGIAWQLLVVGHLRHRLPGISLLLQIVIIGGRGEEQLAAGIDQPLALVGCVKDLLFLLDAFQADQGAVAIVIKRLVERHPLTDLHPSHVGNQPFQLVVCQLLRLLIVCYRLLKLHPHKGGKS